MTTSPNNELVSVAWLVAACGLASSKVAARLPDATKWPDNEFVQVMQVGGTPDAELPIHRPVITVNCFANRPSSLKPPWGQANALAETIWAATFVQRYHSDPACSLTMPAGYAAALVRTVTAVSEPRRVPSDPSQYAVYTLDLQFDWIPASLVIARQ